MVSPGLWGVKAVSLQEIDKAEQAHSAKVRARICSLETDLGPSFRDPRFELIIGAFKIRPHLEEDLGVLSVLERELFLPKSLDLVDESIVQVYFHQRVLHENQEAETNKATAVKNISPAKIIQPNTM